MLKNILDKLQGFIIDGCPYQVVISLIQKPNKNGLIKSYMSK